MALRSLRRGALVCSLAVASSAAGFALGTSARALSGSGLAGELWGVSALSAKDAWAAGKFFPAPSDIGDFKAVTEHRHGTRWSRVTSPSPPGHTAVLLGVSAVSSSDVWAVGFSVSDTGPRTLIEHWNGSSWTVVPGVDPSGSDNELTGVSAVSANDVWAVGYFNTRSGDRTLVEHWDGTKWSRVASPSVGKGSALAAVSALSSKDAWAVGSSGAAKVKTLIEHWDGTGWSRVASPNLSGIENELLGVSARTAKDVWAVGYYGGNSGHHTLIEHWNGTSWSVQ